ncbi:acyl-CoA desaturase [Dactylosporangium vinaceum]|nr:acyl-CoA desaturase [Dactylosporangium vinaceum]UAB99231.1 acyl-CoA desaturase [Dactylosporangium vinaceum]
MPRGDSRLPPVLHPRRLQGRPRTAHRPRRRRLDGGPGADPALGRRPPPPPRVRRQGGDPHSPWLFGTSPAALARGFWHAHLGWVLQRDLTNQERFVPDLLADRDMRVVHRLFGPLTIVTLALPALLGGLISWSWAGALTALFWAGLIRVFALHHVTWSVNSVCHMIGERPFAARDRSANFWPLAILSMGESWHNLHHADPTSARHGVLRGQIDISARTIWLFERLGWAWDVRWPTPARLARITAGVVA